ncbi:MAG: ABC transporter ATP-binding protein [Gammaproteobacteria bacterium]
MPATPAILATGLARRYGRLHAVNGLSLAVHRGEVLALLGPNGAGKTTTLSMLTGTLAPHAGRIRIDDHDLAEAPRQAKQALGYLPESPPLYPELSVDEYLRFCARLHGMARGVAREAAAAATARCGLESVARRLIGHLSKGYKQRVGIAQAIVHQPAVVILDEPTVGLDPVQIRTTRELIRGLAASAAIIVSTHLLNEAAEIASRVVILSHGRIVHETTADAAALQLRLECARPPAADRLRRIAGISAVESGENGGLLLTTDNANDPRPALLAAAVAEDWGLLALTPVRATLEDTFLAALAINPEITA